MYKVILITFIVHIHIPPLITMKVDPTQPNEDTRKESFSEGQTCDLKINRDECNYEDSLCQNNIYNLLKKIEETQPQEIDFCYVIIFLNKSVSNLVTLLEQRSGSGDDGSYTYGFHVVLVVSKGRNSCVYDLDSRLTFPVLFQEYTKKSFINENTSSRLFRIIQGKNFLKYFLTTKSKELNFKRSNNKDGGSGDGKSSSGKTMEELLSIIYYTSDNDSYEKGPEKVGFIVSEKDFKDMFQSDYVSRKFRSYLSVAKRKSEKSKT